MVPEVLIGFKNNLTQKTRNPFFGTLFIVWSTKNWELIYSVIFFPASTSLQDRLNYIRNFFQEEGFYINLLSCIGISILVFISTYLLFFGSKYVVEYYDKVLLPNIGKWIDSKSSIVTRERYDQMETEKNKFQERWEEERNKRFELQNTNDRLEDKYNNLLQGFQQNQEKQPKPTGEFKYNNGGQSIEVNEFDAISIDRIILNLQQSNLTETYLQISKDVLNDRYLRSSEAIEEFVGLELIEPGQDSDMRGNRKYDLTKKGKQLYRTLLANKNEWK